MNIKTNTTKSSQVLKALFLQALLFLIAYAFLNILYPILVNFLHLSSLSLFMFGWNILFLLLILSIGYLALIRLLGLDEYRFKLIFTIVTALVLVLFVNLVSFRKSVDAGEQYMENRAQEYMKERQDIVGTENADVKFIRAEPVYSQTGKLESIIAVFEVNPQKSGDYAVYGDLSAKDVLNIQYMDKDLLIPGKGSYHYSENKANNEVSMTFKYDELYANGYTGPFTLAFTGLRRVHVSLKPLFGEGKEESINVNFNDPGTISVGPFPLTK